MKYIIYDIESQNYVDIFYSRTEYKDQAEVFNSEAEALLEIKTQGTSSMIVIHKDDE